MGAVPCLVRHGIIGYPRPDKLIRIERIRDVLIPRKDDGGKRGLDVVVLKLEQPIYTRTPLTILAAENKSAEKPYKVADKIFTLGHPTGISYDVPVYYSNDKVSMTS